MTQRGAAERQQQGQQGQRGQHEPDQEKRRGRNQPKGRGRRRAKCVRAHGQLQASWLGNGGIGLCEGASELARHQTEGWMALSSIPGSGSVWKECVFKHGTQNDRPKEEKTRATAAGWTEGRVSGRAKRNGQLRQLRQLGSTRLCSGGRSRASRTDHLGRSRTRRASADRRQAASDRRQVLVQETAGQLQLDGCQGFRPRPFSTKAHPTSSKTEGRTSKRLHTTGLRLSLDCMYTLPKINSK